MSDEQDKPLFWMGTSRKDLQDFPDEVKRIVGFALRVAQHGSKHQDAKPLRGFGGAGVLEIVESFEGDAYRTVYTVSFVDAVYVLHAFQKRSTRGIATPQKELDVVHRRLAEARILYSRRTPPTKGGPS